MAEISLLILTYHTQVLIRHPWFLASLVNLQT